MRGKVGVVGFYGYGNFGDEWMLAVMRLLAPDIEFVPFARRESKWEIDESVDALIIGGGDLLIPIPAVGQSYFSNQFLETNKPIIVFGVGIPLTCGYLYEGIEVLNSFLSHPAVKGVWFRSPFDFLAAQFIFHEEVLAKSYVTWDVTYTYPCEPPQTWDTSAAAVCLAPRLRSVWSPQRTAQLEENLAKLGYTTIHYIILGWGDIGKEDLVFTKKMISSSERVIVETDGVDDTLAKLSSYDLIVTCKFHGIIAAALLRRRVKVLSLDNKFLYASLAISGLSWDDFILKSSNGGFELISFERGDYLKVAPSIPNEVASSFKKALNLLF